MVKSIRIGVQNHLFCLVDFVIAFLINQKLHVQKIIQFFDIFL